MSYKGIIEDKSVDPPLPRSIPALRSLMGEVQAAMQGRRMGALQGLIEELQSARRKVYAEMIECSRIGAPADTISAYAGICNESLEVCAEAQSKANGLGSTRP